MAFKADRARRRILTSLAAFAALAVAGCGGVSGTLTPGQDVGGSSPTAAVSGQTIGDGATRVALILPLTGAAQVAATGNAMRNAAEMAVQDFQGGDILVLLKDDGGTVEGARKAAQAAIDEGAEIILGPLFATSVQAAGAVARQAGRPVIAFSTDATVASRGVYLMGFLPQPEVTRVVEYAAQQGRRSIAALIPETVYGNIVEAQLRETAARRGLRVAQIERYAPGQAREAVARLAPVVTGAAPQADALFVPDAPENLVAIGQALQAAGFDPARVKPLGTGVWNDRRVYAVAALQGGWFAAPEQAGYLAFEERYRGRYGTDPVRVATLAYDAVSLVAALNKTQGTQRFSEGVLTNPSGFAGADGVFRFRTDGTNDRGLAVIEVRNGTTATVSPAPRVLTSGT